MRLFKIDNKVYSSVDQASKETGMRPHNIENMLDKQISYNTIHYLTPEEEISYKQTLSTIKSIDNINNIICKLPPTAGLYHIIRGQFVVGNGINWIDVLTGQIVLEDEAMQQRFDITYKAINVNSKRLLQEIVSLIENVSSEFIVRNRTTSQIKYQYATIAEFLESYLDELQKQNIITIHDAIADFRNNSEKDINNGLIKIDIEFKQFNCINTTKLHFIIQAKS